MSANLPNPAGGDAGDGLVGPNPSAYRELKPIPQAPKREPLHGAENIRSTYLGSCIGRASVCAFGSDACQGGQPEL